MLPLLSPLQQVNAATLDTILLLNRGDHFQFQPLPIEAQFSPVFGIGVGDFDGDGNEDLFFAQNSFDLPEGRLDAGCGLWLCGNGDGTFRAIGPAQSGIILNSEGRGVALVISTMTADSDLADGENNGPTRLFRNQLSKPGMTVHLQGPDENLQAIGATVRLVYKTGNVGPVHALQLGSGYCSQDSTDIILGIKKENRRPSKFDGQRQNRTSGCDN